MQRQLFAVLLLCVGITSMHAHKVALVTSAYHESITTKLLEGATTCLYRSGIKPEDISIAYVPGSFEIPLIVKLLAETNRFDAIITLGAIITFNNPHWNFIADHVTRNIADLSLTYNIPITWGLFICESEDQALEKINNLEKNRGQEAAQAALGMIGLSKQIKHFAQTLT